MDDSVVVVAQAEIQREIFLDAPIILNERSFREIVNMPNRRSSHKRVGGEGNSSAGITGKEVFKCGAGRKRGSADAREQKVAFAVTKRAAAEAVAVELTSKFDGVFSYGIRNMVNHLVSLIRTLDHGPFKSTQCFEQPAERANFNSGQAAVERIGYTVVDTQAGSGLAMVSRKSRLVKPVVAKS